MTWLIEKNTEQVHVIDETPDQVRIGQRRPALWRGLTIFYRMEGDSQLLPAGPSDQVLGANESYNVSYEDLDHCTQEELWDSLEQELKQYQCQGTRTRINLCPGAPRDEQGKHVRPLPSDRVQSGRIFEIVRRLEPKFDFDTLAINQFTKAEECQWHYDRDNGNDGVSEIAFFDTGTVPFKGGALLLETGESFEERRQWHRYNGSKVRHGVAPLFRPTYHGGALHLRPKPEAPPPRRT